MVAPLQLQYVYPYVLSWMVEKVMILRENRPLFRSRENSSHIYSPFPAVRPSVRPSARRRVGSGRFPSSCASRAMECPSSPPPLSPSARSLLSRWGITEYMENGGRGRRMKISISIVSVDGDLRSPLHSIMGCRRCRPPLAPLGRRS